MRLPALLFVTVLALLPAAARAQVVVQDPSETFLDDRTRHQQRMDQNPDKWWNGDVYDRASASTLYDPHEFSTSPYILNPPGGQTGQPTQAAATPVPGNPETVKPLFSFDEMNEAGNEGAESEAPIDFSNPTDIENAARNLGVNAMRIMGGGVGGGVTPVDPPQPVPSQEAAPAPVRAETLPAAAPYVPSDPKPAAAPPIAPPPVEDEANATKINPADAPADPAATAQPASATTTAIPALEDAAAPAAELPAAAAPPAFGTGVVPGRESDAPTGLTP